MFGAELVGADRRRAAAALRLAGDAAGVSRSSASRCCYFPTARRSSIAIAGSTPRMAAVAAPMLVISLLAAAFLLGVDARSPPLAWFATHGWIFDASFALALAANVLIVIEGIGRYRQQPRCQRAPPHSDRGLHRRARGVRLRDQGRRAAAVVARRPAGRAALADRSGAAGDRAAAGVRRCPYAVAVKHVFSPRTVLRRGLQYALARRTLSVLVAAADRGARRSRCSANAIGRSATSSSGSRSFYAISLGLAALGLPLSRSRRSTGSIGGSSAPSTTRARFSSRSPTACRTRHDPRSWSRWC